MNTTFAKAKRIAAFLSMLGLVGAVKLLTGGLFNREFTAVPADVDDSKLDEYYFVVGTSQAPPAVSCADFIRKFSSEQRINQLRQVHESGLVGQGVEFNTWLLSLDPVNTAIEKALARMV